MRTFQQSNRMTRRRFLKLLGATVGGAAAVSTGTAAFLNAANTPTGRATARGISFSNVVNAVDDLGMDDSGGSAIDDILDNNAQDDTLIQFPPGEYKVSSNVLIGEVNNFGMVGTGDSPRDTKFVIPEGDGVSIAVSNGGRNHVYENFTVDYTGERTGVSGITPRIEDGLEAHNLHFVGFNPSEGSGGVGDLRDNISPQILDPDGVGNISGLVREGPTQIVSHGHLGGNSNTGSIWMGQRHEGTLNIRNSIFANTGTNAIYASRTNGIINLENCLFRNNNQYSLRLGGGNGSGTHTIRNCSFLVDTDLVPDGNDGELINPNILGLEAKKTPATRIEVIESDFWLRKGPDRATIAFIDDNMGPVFFENCRFRNDIDGTRVSINASRFGGSNASDDRIRFQGCHVTGDSDERPIEYSGRDAVFEDGCINMPNAPDPQGIELRNVNSGSCETPTITEPDGSNTGGNSTGGRTTSGGTTGSGGSANVNCDPYFE